MSHYVFNPDTIGERMLAVINDSYTRSINDCYHTIIASRCAEIQVRTAERDQTEIDGIRPIRSSAWLESPALLRKQ